jgi:hypothetical protein
MLASSTPQPLSREEEENQRLVNLLQQQFANLEEYCNCQTQLHNSCVEEDRRFQASSIQACMDQLEKALGKVQNDMQAILLISMPHHRRMDVLSEHIHLSERVVRTIFENGAMLHANGVPATKDNTAIKTVALSSLRASIARVQRKLGK